MSARRSALAGAALTLAAAVATAAGGLPRPPLSAQATPPANGLAAPPLRPVPGPAKAAPAPPVADEVDDELLEFLGSVGDDDDSGDWLDFLASTDVDKVAKRRAKAPPRDE